MSGHKLPKRKRRQPVCVFVEAIMRRRNDGWAAI
jgi:hypothetical protein